jgi:hypothetical protein
MVESTTALDRLTSTGYNVSQRTEDRVHLNHQRGEGHNRRKAADYPYSDTSYLQEVQGLARSQRRRDDRTTAREGRHAHEASKAIDPDVPVLVLLREP